MIGAACSRSEHEQAASGKHPWTVTFGYRYQPSSRHYIGTVEQVQREINNNQIQNIYHMFDLSVERDISRRVTANASVPLIIATRNQLYSPRGEYKVAGAGDATVGVRAWLFRPPTESGDNVAVGFGLKLPTGIYNATGSALDARGNPVRATADQSVQLGDGRVGFSLDLQAYKRTYFQSTLYFTGVYLFNPANTNGVSTFRTRPGETVMSVTDQYLYRGGVSRAVPKLRGLNVTLGGRIEGVPVHDAFGRSDGFRRPGYAISVDPGFTYYRRRYIFALNVPFAVERNRRRSVSDYANGIHGDAAFADYTLIMSLSRRF